MATETLAPRKPPPTPTPLTLGTMIPPISFCATLSYLCQAPIWIRRCGSSRTPMPDNTSHPSICLRPQAPGTIRRRRHPTPPYGIRQITRVYIDPPSGKSPEGINSEEPQKMGHWRRYLLTPHKKPEACPFTRESPPPAASGPCDTKKIPVTARQSPRCARASLCTDPSSGRLWLCTRRLGIPQNRHSTHRHTQATPATATPQTPTRHAHTATQPRPGRHPPSPPSQANPKIPDPR